MAYSADGRTLTAETGGGIIRTWDASTGRPQPSIQNELLASSREAAFALSPDAGLLAASENFNRGYNPGPVGIRLVALPSQGVLRTLEAAGGAPLSAIAISRDGNRLAAAGWFNSILVWDMAEGKRLRSWKADEEYARAYEFSADGKTLVTGGHDKAIRFWDVASGKKKREITGHPKPVGKLALSTDGTLLATVGMNQEPYLPWNNVARIWDVASGKVRHELTMPVKKQFGDGSLGFGNLAFAPDGKTLVTAGKDDMLRFWNVDTGKELRQISLGNRTYWGLRGAAALAFAPDGKTLAVGTNAIWLLDTVSGRDVRAFGSHRNGIHATATSDGTTVFTAGDEGIVVIWDTATGRERGRLEGEDQTINAIAVVNGGRRLLTSGIHVWDLTTNNQLRWIRAPYAYRVRAPLAISPDERTLAVPGEDNGVALIDLETGKEMVSCKKHDAFVSGAAFHPDGRTLIVLCHDHTAHVWDLKTGRRLSQFEFAELQPFSTDGQPIRPLPPPSGKGGRNGYGYAAAVSPDGRLIAYGSHWHYLAIHEVLTGKIVRRIDKLLPDGAGTLAFSHDGRTLAWSGWEQPTINLLELATGKERYRFEGHKRRVTSLAFSADGRTLISGSEDTSALVWDIAGNLSQKKGPLDVDTAWRDLAGVDAGTAYQAMRRLAAAPTEAIPFLRKHLQAVPVVDEKRLAGLIADLDNEVFAVREKATKDLEHLGEVAVGACQKALQGQPSAEVRRRLESFLRKEAKSASEPRPERLRAVRAIEVLEHLGTLPAQELLKSLASGAPAARLTQDLNQAIDVARIGHEPVLGPG